MYSVLSFQQEPCFIYNTGPTTYSAAPQSFDFILLFSVPSLEGLMMRKGAVGSREDGQGVHREISQWGLILFGEWGRIYIRTRNPLPQHAQAHTFYRKVVGSACSCAGGGGWVYDGRTNMTPFLDPVVTVSIF